jgi:hypothetical protein
MLVLHWLRYLLHWEASRLLHPRWMWVPLSFLRPSGPGRLDREVCKGISCGNPRPSTQEALMSPGQVSMCVHQSHLKGFISMDSDSVGLRTCISHKHLGDATDGGSGTPSAGRNADLGQSAKASSNPRTQNPILGFLD